MKIGKSYLNRLIKEEVENAIDKKEYTEQDAHNALMGGSYQFTLQGAKKIHGRKRNLPSYYELNTTSEEKFKILKTGEKDYRIIAPLIDRTVNDSGIAVRRGDVFVLELSDVSEKECIKIAYILQNIKYDARTIISNDGKEGNDILDYIIKKLPELMNK